MFVHVVPSTNMLASRKPEFNFSVIIPTYNCAKYLPIAINSILTQDYGYNQVQILIIDDGCTDETPSVVQEFLDKYPENIFYFKKPNGNWGSVINYVKKHKLAKGKMITILDSDDYFGQNALTKVANHLDEQMVVCSFNCLTNKKQVVLNPFFGKTRRITNKHKLRTPHSQPLLKFYCHDLFYSLDDLVENIWYQDCIMYHDAISKTSSVYYIREPLATWYSSRLGNSTTAPWSNDLKFETWCNILKHMCLNDAGVVVYIYTLLPGFIEELKQRNRIIELPCRPSYTWLPKILEPFFAIYVHFKTKKVIRYTDKKQKINDFLLNSKKTVNICNDLQKKGP